MAAPAAGSQTSLDDLGDDSVGEVLIRLPSQASLTVASAVCKRWRGLCTSPAFLRRFRFRRRHLGSPFLGLLHSAGGIWDLRVLRDAGARSRPDIAAPLRAVDGAVHGLTRFRRYQDLQILDYRDGRFLLKPRKYNHLFLYDLLTGGHAELKWPLPHVFSDMTGFLLDGGNVVFVCKNEPSDNPNIPPRCERDHSCLYSAGTGEWQLLQPPCRDADAARYAVCRHDVAWSQCAGEVIYSRCSHHDVGRCLVALDTRTMSRSIVTLPRYLQRIPCPWMKTKSQRDFTLMEMDDRGNIGLVAADERKFVLRVWLRREEGGNTSATCQGEEWTLYRKVMLQGLAHQVAERYAVHLNALQVVAAYSGTVHLRMVVEDEEQAEGSFCFFPAKEQVKDRLCFFASLNLACMEFSNVQSETVCEQDRFYPLTLPWRAPFLPPPEFWHGCGEWQTVLPASDTRGQKKQMCTLSPSPSWTCGGPPAGQPDSPPLNQKGSCLILLEAVRGSRCSSRRLLPVLAPTRPFGPR
ncbi:uncharacterized protein [Setaria viridis]|uniref:F-box domain-containing protein n=1 Tax=Setaria viridis TaxID=4556 RepID=A0A4V6DB64_SETVI|nr:hypothetical protein SEVIR_2G169450v2 [Setaria viridis]